MTALPIRVTIEFESEAAEQLNQDAERLGSTKSFFIQRAMTVLATLLQMRQAGDKLIVRRKDGTEESFMLL